jgi:hypothetical protein
MEDSDPILEGHVAEAVQYRRVVIGAG